MLTPKKSDISVTSDSGQCPSPTEYRPKYFEEPECPDSDKENMPPIESITPPSLKNLSLEEENDDDNNNNEHEATSWEASVARNVDLLPRSSSPYPKKKTRTLEDLETNTDDNMVDMTNFFDRPQNEKRSPRLTQNNAPLHRTVPHTCQRAQCQHLQYHLQNPIEMRLGGSYQIKEEYPMVGQLVLEGSHPG